MPTMPHGNASTGVKCRTRIRRINRMGAEVRFELLPGMRQIRSEAQCRWTVFRVLQQETLSRYSIQEGV